MIQRILCWVGNRILYWVGNRILYWVGNRGFSTGYDSEDSLLGRNPVEGGSANLHKTTVTTCGETETRPS